MENAKLVVCQTDKLSGKSEASTGISLALVVILRANSQDTQIEGLELILRHAVSLVVGTSFRMFIDSYVVVGFH